MGKNKNKKNTHNRESPWSPGRQEAFPWGLAGFPGPPSRPRLHLPGGGGLRPSWAGPRSKCPLPPGEEGWLGGGHCSPVRSPMGTWSPVVRTPADAAERAVQWGLAGGPQRAPAWASSLSSPGLKPSVYMGCQEAHGASCSWGWPAPHSHAWIEAGGEAPE